MAMVKVARPVHDPKAFKVGDKVQVYRKVTSAEGWDDGWSDKDMDPTVGMYGEVIYEGSSGFKVKLASGAGWYYPSCALEFGGGNVTTSTSVAAAVPAKKKRVRVQPDGPWDAAPCTHLRWQLMGFFREKLAFVNATTTVTLPDGSKLEVPFTKVEVACTKCNTKMTMKAKG